MKVTFSKTVGFRAELNRRVEEYFTSHQIKPRDNPAMYFKTLAIATWIGAAWTGILFGPPILWVKALGCIVLGLGVAGCGMSVGHDANHGGYSSNPLINRMIGFSYDFIGVSSFLWKFRHNKLHHIYTNIQGYDGEIDGGELIRLSPHGEYRPHHRSQHLWIWFLYALIPFNWYIRDTKRVLFEKHFQGHPLPRMSPWDYLVFWSGRLLGFIFFVGIPLMVGYSPLQVVIGLCLVFMSYGVVVGEVFMLAHVMETVEFPIPDAKSNQIEEEWAISQMKTTVDFAPHNKILNWYVGGLNYQVIHHLFPHICHIHYPQIAPIVAEVCAEFGVKYQVYPTLKSAIASNYRWIRQMSIQTTSLNPR